MKYTAIFSVILAGVCIFALNSHSGDGTTFGTYTSEQFRDYWYHRGAEISRFELQQMRYGELHRGDAVLVFVTEKMNPAIQIKADNPGPESLPVLKLNAVRKFFTGIYPYSILTSVFTPVNVEKNPLPPKISTSIQEWCGHVYTQMNLRNNTYRIRTHSYFEKEGDQDYSVADAMPEEAVWNLIRIAPRNLPQGNLSMIPATLHARLAHRKIAPQKAVARLAPVAENSREGNPLVCYEVKFPVAERTLRIYFERVFPYRIQKWEESYPSLRDAGNEKMTTRAVRTHTIMNAYWKHNSNGDRALLNQLGLDAREMGSN